MIRVNSQATLEAKNMKKISMVTIAMFIVASCGGTGTYVPPPGSSSFITQSDDGFTASVGDDYSAAAMQSEFGGYCESKGKATRSLIKKKSENGGSIVVGSCL